MEKTVELDIPHDVGELDHTLADLRQRRDEAAARGDHAEALILNDRVLDLKEGRNSPGTFSFLPMDMKRRIAAALVHSPECDVFVDDVDMRLALEAADAEMKKPKAITEFIHPPIPQREFDWSAVRDGYEPKEPIGFGKTELEAIESLIEAEEE